MRTKLADPAYEPTDDELRALSRAAFADVASRHQTALAKLFNLIEVQRQLQGPPLVENTAALSGT
ncbi:MAG TPA: hypothetical protein VN764_06050 [Polyangiaceae bacterium]|nr:hypothetical protein [Polyangiaceae bacterium]